MVVKEKIKINWGLSLETFKAFFDEGD